MTLNNTQKIVRERPVQALPNTTLRRIYRSFVSRNPHSIVDICFKNLEKIYSIYPLISSVANCVRFPLGEIDGFRIGVHVYIGGGSSPPIHSHVQEIDTMVIRGVFEDEIYEFKPDNNGRFSRFNVSKTVNKDNYDLEFTKLGNAKIKNQSKRVILQGRMDTLKTDKAHRVIAEPGVVTIYCFRGQIEKCDTYVQQEKNLTKKPLNNIPKEEIVYESMTYLKAAFENKEDVFRYT